MLRRIFAYCYVGVIALLVLLIVIDIAVESNETASTASQADQDGDGWFDRLLDRWAADLIRSAAPPMTATVQIMPGAVNVINEDTFPWYGLTITLDDRYSTKYRFGDWNWGWLREDSILEPNEEIGPPIHAFIDKNGNEYEGELYTIIATDVTLEAKTRVDGPYDLKATFEFTKEDPIIEHYIARTNRPTTDEPHATPYALTEELERRPTLHIYVKDQAVSFWYVEHHVPEYDAIKEFVSEYPQNSFGSYILPAEAFEELETAFAPERRQERLERRQRWDEQWGHWKNVDAFKDSMNAINEDRIIDKEESRHICFALEQWTAQMTSARDYVQDYRKDEAALVEKNPGLGNLEQEANHALELLSKVECE